MAEPPKRLFRNAPGRDGTGLGSSDHGRFRGIGEFQGLPPARLRIGGEDFGEGLGEL